MITTAPLLVNSFAFIVSYTAQTSASLVLLLPIVAKVTEVFLKYASYIRSGGLWISGFKDVYVNGLGARQKIIEENQKYKKQRRFSRYLTPRRLNVKIKRVEANIFRGMLLLSAGALATWMAIQSREYENVHSSYLIANKTVNVFLLFANILTLYQNVQTYQEAREARQNAFRDKDYKHFLHLIHSAFLGIISSLGSIFIAGCTILSFAATFIFVIGILASMIGFLKVIHDYLCLSKK